MERNIDNKLPVSRAALDLVIAIVPQYTMRSVEFDLRWLGSDTATTGWSTEGGRSARILQSHYMIDRQLAARIDALSTSPNSRAKTMTQATPATAQAVTPQQDF